MPKTPDETLLNGATYPDDAPGRKWTILEYAYYDAQDPEDAAELPDGAQYGLWLHVEETGTDADTFLAAPRSLREFLHEEGAEEGDTFEVFEMKKGDGQHDPYHVEARLVQPGDSA
jgi:hypothetical protein